MLLQNSRSMAPDERESLIAQHPDLAAHLAKLHAEWAKDVTPPGDATGSMNAADQT